VVVFVFGVELLGRVPVVVGLAEPAVVLVDVGAVLSTYFGLRRFEPAPLPG
jgi:hypothetical protein